MQPRLVRLIRSPVGANPIRESPLRSVPLEIWTIGPVEAIERDVLFGEGRVAEVLRPGHIWADMTTGDPGETREMAARGSPKKGCR